MRLLIPVLFISTISFSQSLMPLQHDTLNHSYELILNGTLDYASTSAQNALLDKMLVGGEITEEIKNNSFDRHSSINRFGSDLHAEVEFRNFKSNLFGKERFGWLVKGEINNFSALQYSKDLFGLVYYGNEQYLGQEIDFSGTAFYNWSFQKVGFGIIDKKTKSNLSLNIYNTGAYAKASVSDGRIYQGTEGDSLNIIYDGYAEYAISENLNSGLGLGIDADIRIPVVFENERRAYIQVLVKNLGIAYLNEIHRYEADTIFTFDGLTFEQLTGNSTILDSNFSYLDTLNIHESEFSAIRFLPAFFQAGKIVDEFSSKKLQSFFGVRLYPSFFLIPQLYAGLHYQPNKWLSVGLNAAYGGYSKFRAGLYAGFTFSKFNVGISSENIIGDFSTKGSGRSLLMRLRWQI